MKLYGIDGGGWTPEELGRGRTMRRGVAAPGIAEAGLSAKRDARGCRDSGMWTMSAEPGVESGRRSVGPRPYMHRPAWKLYFAGLCFWLALATWLLW